MTKPLTDSDLIAIEARCAAATPGPWVPSTGDPCDDDPHRQCVLRKTPPQYFIAVIENGAPGDTMETEKHTATFIAAAREDVPRLVAEVRRLRVILEKRGDE